MATFSRHELEEINAITSIYDKYADIIKNKVKDPSTFNKFIKNVASEFMKKNDSKLNTNIVGRQIIFNKSIEDDMFKLFDLSREDIKNSILNSEYFKKFGKELSLTDQLVVAIPLIFASLEYHKLGKKEESQFLFLFAAFKPYASRESNLFKFGVDENRMLYTVERDLTDRFDLKINKTILLALTKRSESAWENYIRPLKKNDKLSDRDFQVIYQSGIATRVNDFLKKIVERYTANVGKSLDFESGVSMVIDKDTDSAEFSSMDIESDAAVKTKIINNVMTAVSKNPVDKKILLLACNYEFGIGNGKSNMAKLESTINNVIDKMFGTLQEFFSELISSFLTDVSLGRKITIEDFKTPIFIKVGLSILTGKKSHLTNKSMLNVRKIFNNMLETYLEDYNIKKDTYKESMKRALAAYWIFLVRLSNGGK